MEADKNPWPPTGGHYDNCGNFFFDDQVNTEDRQGQDKVAVFVTLSH